LAKLLVYYAHPGQRFSNANAAMAQAARGIQGITFVDLYAEYPRHDIVVDREQQRLLDHDVILFQFPLFWYSSPSLVKEWQDLVLEHGFAYGHGGDRLAGKTMMLAVTAAGSAEAYTPEGYQNYALRDFLTPLEQTARLCEMRFASPFVLHGALAAQQTGEIAAHAQGYARLLTALRDDRYDFDTAAGQNIVTHDTLPILPNLPES
jgi:glutathione-regulated potassium-efflux system ancillary protein KefG